MLNQEREGNPLGGVREQTDRESPLYGDTVRIAWSMVDSPGASLPWLETTLRRGADLVFGDVRQGSFTDYKLDTFVHEDDVAYGLVGLFLLIPLLVVALVPGRPRAHACWPARRFSTSWCS